MLLNVKNIRKDYTRGKLFSAVDNVSFSLQQGDFACIMGKSGSGKTTLLNIIGGITTPTSGSVTFDTVNLYAMDDVQASLFRNQTIGYVPQGGSLLANLTAFDNICLPYYLHFQQNQQNMTVKACQERALELLQQAGISYLTDMFPKQMSGGEMRRVAIVRALICSPKLVLADEPTNDLDDESTQEIMQLFKNINQNGTTLLMVTHDNDVAGYAKQSFKMVAGKLTSIDKIS